MCIRDRLKRRRGCEAGHTCAAIEHDVERILERMASVGQPPVRIDVDRGEHGDIARLAYAHQGAFQIDRISEPVEEDRVELPIGAEPRKVRVLAAMLVQGVLAGSIERQAAWSDLDENVLRGRLARRSQSSIQKLGRAILHALMRKARFCHARRIRHHALHAREHAQEMCIRDRQPPVRTVLRPR